MPDDAEFFPVFAGACGKEAVPVFFELVNRAFNFRFVNTMGDMVDAVVDVERFAEVDEQVLLVELGISLDCLVLDSLCDLPQLRHGLFLKFLVRIGHTLSLLSFSSSFLFMKKQNSFSNDHNQENVDCEENKLK
jgi:hypothetical protein